MAHEKLPQDLLRLVTPQQARSYALGKGWQRVSGVNGTIALFSRPGSEVDQLIVPMDPTFDDYPRRIEDLISNLAEVEQRATDQILQDLLQPDADVVRYTVRGTGAEKGMLPLREGLNLLEGAKRSLLAAACSVISPVTHHPRMSRTEASQLLDACRLGQTERGSFTVTISCPLRAIEQDQALLPYAEPFTRLATSMLIRSAQRLVSAIESDQVPTVYESQKDLPTLSANFCDAILRMQPPEERSSLSLSVSWASTLPAPDMGAAMQCVTFQADYFSIIEDIYKKLRPSPEPVKSLFIGQVDALNGNLGDDGQMQGEVTLLVVREDELVKVRTDLNATDYQSAVDAHRKAGYVKCHGVIHLGRRVHRLTEVTEFVCVQD